MRFVIQVSQMRGEGVDKNYNKANMNTSMANQEYWSV